MPDDVRWIDRVVDAFPRAHEPDERLGLILGADHRNVVGYARVTPLVRVSRRAVGPFAIEVWRHAASRV